MGRYRPAYNKRKYSPDRIVIMKRTRGEDTTDTESEASTKRSQSSSSSESAAKHAVRYESKWEREFPWIEPVKEAGNVVGMVCRICKRHNSKAKYNRSSVWNEKPCTYLRKDSVRRHDSSDQHKQAVKKESLRQASSVDGGIAQAFQKELTLKKSAVKGALQCLYWLVKSEIPHTTHYNSLLKAVQFMGLEKLKHLHQAENAKYTSQRIIQEFLQVVGHYLEQQQLQDLFASPFFSLMIDESTDIAVLNEMVIYARYITPNADVKTVFMKIVPLFNGTAGTIEEAVIAFLEEKAISISQMLGFATDGASVMTGRLNGVAARLKRRQPILTSIHCLAHRLAFGSRSSRSKGHIHQQHFQAYTFPVILLL